MAKITKKEVIGALEQAAVVLIGGLLILAIPVAGPLLSKLPTWSLGVTAIALPAIMAGAVAVLAYNLIKAKIKG